MKIIIEGHPYTIGLRYIDGKYKAVTYIGTRLYIFKYDVSGKKPDLKTKGELAGELYMEVNHYTLDDIYNDPIRTEKYHQLLRTGKHI